MPHIITGEISSPSGASAPTAEIFTSEEDQLWAQLETCEISITRLTRAAQALVAEKHYLDAIRTHAVLCGLKSERAGIERRFEIIGGAA